VMLPAIAATTVNPSQMYRMVENVIMVFTMVTSLAWRHRWRPVPAECPIVAHGRATRLILSPAWQVG
jgi:hypothetical protein